MCSWLQLASSVSHPHKHHGRRAPSSRGHCDGLGAVTYETGADGVIRAREGQLAVGAERDVVPDDGAPVVTTLHRRLRSCLHPLPGATFGRRVMLLPQLDHVPCTSAIRVGWDPCGPVCDARMTHRRSAVRHRSRTMKELRSTRCQVPVSCRSDCESGRNRHPTKPPIKITSAASNSNGQRRRRFTGSVIRPSLKKRTSPPVRGYCSRWQRPTIADGAAKLPVKGQTSSAGPMHVEEHRNPARGQRRMEHYQIRMENGFWTFRQVSHLCHLGRAFSRMQVLVGALSHLQTRTGLLHCDAELEVFRMKGEKEATYNFADGREPVRTLHPSSRSRASAAQETEFRGDDVP